jgi:hypothetical protein
MRKWAGSGRARVPRPRPEWRVQPRWCLGGSSSFLFHHCSCLPNTLLARQNESEKILPRHNPDVGTALLDQSSVWPTTTQLFPHPSMRLNEQRCSVYGQRAFRRWKLEPGFSNKSFRSSECRSTMASRLGVAVLWSMGTMARVTLPSAHGRQALQ